MSVKLQALGEIVRPSNVALFFLSILLGAFVTAGVEAFREAKVWWAALSGTLVGAAANVINDVMDIEIDRINKPKRPLARGALTAKEALVLACTKRTGYLGSYVYFHFTSHDCNWCDDSALRL